MAWTGPFLNQHTHSPLKMQSNNKMQFLFVLYVTRCPAP